MATKIEAAQSIVIIGLGQTGLSCARFLVQQGLNVAVIDTRQHPPGLSVLQHELPEVLIKTGGLDSGLMMQADLIVLSPGIDPRLAEIVSARESGIELVGDIELFSRYANAPIVAITGSNGKSTVTTLLAEMAIEAGKTIQVGGNLGTPALELIVDPAPDFYIVELSSFQLETVRTLNAFVSVVLNLSPDHLDRYDSEQDYHAAKSTIYDGNGVMIINQDDEHVLQLSRAQRNQIGFSLHDCEGVDFGLITEQGRQYLVEGKQKLISVDELNIKGSHNIANALAALALGSAMGLAMPAMLNALQQFRGLAHRCRLVVEHNEIAWFNDSKATNVGACIAAIEGLAEMGKIILIAGGVGKEQDFSELSAIIEQHVSVVIVMGEDAPLLAAIVPDSVICLSAKSMESSVLLAQKNARQGDIVLLSPACASFDMFSGYQQRGDVFESLVRDVTND